MATGEKDDLTIRGGGFDVGEQVAASERHGDFFLPGSPTVATATVNKDGEAVFKGLDYGTYWVHRLEEPYRQLTVHHKRRPESAVKPDQATIDARLAATRAPTGQARMVTGAVGTQAVGRLGVAFANSQLTDRGSMPGDYLAHEQDRDKAREKWEKDDGIVKGSPVGEETPKDLRDPNEATPRLAQEDARDVTQRSATLTGEAHPNDPDEPLPAPRQDQVDPKQLQRSATPYGEAAPIPDGEASPHVRQEDARDLVQRSATETGEAKPKPVTKEPETTRVKESAEQKAIGHAPQVVTDPAVSSENPHVVDDGAQDVADADDVAVPTDSGLKTEREAKQIRDGKPAIEAKPKRGKAKAAKKQGVKTKAKDKSSPGADTVRKGAKNKTKKS